MSGKLKLRGPVPCGYTIRWYTWTNLASRVPQMRQRAVSSLFLPHLCFLGRVRIFVYNTVFLDDLLKAWSGRE